MPLAPGEIDRALAAYSERPWVASIGSHSAVDITDGAAQEGFRTLVVGQRGRDQLYRQYFRSRRDPEGRLLRGCVDEVWTLERFSEILTPEVQGRLRERSALLVPNRSLSTYVPLDGIEGELRVPIVGSRELLRIEERSERENYYTLLERAGLRTPQRVADPSQIEGLSIVKLPHARRRIERGFFTAASPPEFERKRDALLKAGTILPEDLATARIERFVLGPVFNFDFFFSPLVPRADGLELLGVDERKQSSLDGLLRLPAAQQLEIEGPERFPEYTEVGHASLTVRESLLEEVYRMGETFVEAARSFRPPGVLGPFCLQTCLDPDGRPTIFDVAVRIGGGTNAHLALGHPYGNALHRTPMSTGRRIALEIREALRLGRLREIVT